MPRPGAVGTHQLDLLLPGEDSSRAEVGAGQGGGQERGAGQAPSVRSLGSGKGEEGSGTLKVRGTGKGQGQTGAASTNCQPRTCHPAGIWAPQGAGLPPFPWVQELPSPPPQQHHCRELC